MVLTDGQAGTMTIGMYMFITAFGGASASGATTDLGYGSMLAVLNFTITLIVGTGILVLLRRREVQL
jgi:raffinose/stachyose/melibiose transport system permease protein